MEEVVINGQRLSWRPLHTCNVCGCQFHWDDKTKQPSYLMVMCGSGYQSYEMNFIACSVDCQVDCEDALKAFVKKHNGKMPKEYEKVIGEK